MSISKYKDIDIHYNNILDYIIIRFVFRYRTITN